MEWNFNDKKWTMFASEIEAMGTEIIHQTGIEDFKQLKKMELWGRLATFFGYLTAWIFPNPLSIWLISQGNYTRWAIVFHQVSHGAFDRIPNIPPRYTSHYFAKGYRRCLDWFDWITAENWHYEHNKLHHYYLGTKKDPDVVWRNAKIIRELPLPLYLRYLISIFIASIWKLFYYAPNTIAESRHYKGLLRSNKIGWNNWNPFTAEGKELWIEGLLPYFLYRFILLPLLFSPLGKWAALSVLINSILAEILTNLHSFATIGPNHTGDDIYTFSDSSKCRAEFYLRQIIGTVNFPSHNDWRDFLYGGMNYQIEHHLWPDATLLQCQRVRPKLIALCKKYGIHYHESKIFPRVLMTIRMMAGSCKVLEIQTKAKVQSC